MFLGLLTGEDDVEVGGGMKASRLFGFVLAVVVAGLVMTNPNEADFREHVRVKEGLAGTIGMVAADLLSGGKGGGIQRDNYFVASRFYIGGNGILPRQDVAWGVAGKFFEIEGGGTLNFER
jgi:hypothetical protein